MGAGGGMSVLPLRPPPPRRYHLGGRGESARAARGAAATAGHASRVEGAAGPGGGLGCRGGCCARLGRGVGWRGVVAVAVVVELAVAIAVRAAAGTEIGWGGSAAVVAAAAVAPRDGHCTSRTWVAHPLSFIASCRPSLPPIAPRPLWGGLWRPFATMDEAATCRKSYRWPAVQDGMGGGKLAPRPCLAVCCTRPPRAHAGHSSPSAPAPLPASPSTLLPPSTPVLPPPSPRPPCATAYGDPPRRGTPPSRPPGDARQRGGRVGGAGDDARRWRQLLGAPYGGDTGMAAATKVTTCCPHSLAASPMCRRFHGGGDLVPQSGHAFSSATATAGSAVRSAPRFLTLVHFQVPISYNFTVLPCPDECVRDGHARSSMRHAHLCT